MQYCYIQLSPISEFLNFKKNGIWRQPELCPNFECPSIGTVAGHYEQLVVPTLSDIRFVKYYRISRDILNYMNDVLSPVLKKSNTNYRSSICVEKIFLISIHILKSNCDAQSVASIYKVGKSTVTSVVIEFCEAIIKILYKTSVKYPHSEIEKCQIANRINERWQFPNTFGALDGSHIPILKPNDNDVDYFNYKKIYSIVLLALIDDKFMLR